MQRHFTERLSPMLCQIITTILQTQLVMIKATEYNRIYKLFRLKLGCSF